MQAVRTFQFPGMVVRVHIPELTHAEREKRMKAIHRTAADLVASNRNKKVEQ